MLEESKTKEKQLMDKEKVEATQNLLQKPTIFFHSKTKTIVL